jgi:plastocyanin
MENAMVRTLSVVLLAVLSLLPAQRLLAAPLRGQILLPADYPGRVLTQAAGFWLLPNDVLETKPPLVDARTEMVVTLEGSDIVGATLVKPTMRIEDARFTPAILPAAPHTKVVFENLDGVVHQLESAGRPSIPKHKLEPKASFSHVFDTPGSYPLRCTELPHMNAIVFVTGAPLFVQPDATGAFVFPDVRPGTYSLSVWYWEKWIHRQQINVKPNATTVEVRLKSLPGKDKK